MRSQRCQHDGCDAIALASDVSYCREHNRFHPPPGMMPCEVCGILVPEPHRLCTAHGCGFPGCHERAARATLADVLRQGERVFDRRCEKHATISSCEVCGQGFQADDKKIHRFCIEHRCRVTFCEERVESGRSYCARHPDGSGRSAESAESAEKHLQLLGEIRDELYAMRRAFEKFEERFAGMGGAGFLGGVIGGALGKLASDLPPLPEGKTLDDLRRKIGIGCGEPDCYEDATHAEKRRNAGGIARWCDKHVPLDRHLHSGSDELALQCQKLIGQIRDNYNSGVYRDPEET